MCWSFLPYRLPSVTTPFLFAVAQLLIAELSVDSAGYGQVTEAFQFRVEFLYDFVSIGFGNAQFLRHFIDPHKRLFFCHTQKYLPFLVVIVFLFAVSPFRLWQATLPGAVP